MPFFVFFCLFVFCLFFFVCFFFLIFFLVFFWIFYDFFFGFFVWFFFPVFWANYFPDVLLKCSFSNSKKKKIAEEILREHDESSEDDFSVIFAFNYFFFSLFFLVFIFLVNFFPLKALSSSESSPRASLESGKMKGTVIFNLQK